MEGDEFIVVCHEAKARTYVKPNALLDSINSGLYSGPPFRMDVRTNVPPEELRELPKHTSVYFVRED
jgi:hypothetical protein